jgi:hypothetical protein
VAFALLGIATLALGVALVLSHFLLPALLTAGLAVLRTLPAIPLAMVLVPVAALELTFGLCLLLRSSVHHLERT